MARPMATDPPFATVNHCTADVIARYSVRVIYIGGGPPVWTAYAPFIRHWTSRGFPMTARRTDGSIRPGSSPAEVVLGGVAEFERELIRARLRRREGDTAMSAQRSQSGRAAEIIGGPSLNPQQTFMHGWLAGQVDAGPLFSLGTALSSPT